MQYSRHVQDVDLQLMRPSCNVADEERDQRMWLAAGTESVAISVSDEVLPLPTASDGLRDSHREGSNSHGQHREQRLSVRETISTKNVLKDVIHPDKRGGEAHHGLFSRLRQFVLGPTFESCFAMLILANTLMLAIESQYVGIDVGWKIGYPGSRSSGPETWPGAIDIFQVAELIFGVLFTIELLLRLAFLRKSFFSDIWNLVDSIIVISWFLTVAALFPFPIDPMLLRLARLARLLRLLRLIRKIRLFDSLYLMTTAMRGSFFVLLWSVVLLCLVQMLASLFLQSLLEEYIVDKDKPEVARLEVFMYYGTFARNMLTMFEITLGNWMPPCRALVENVSEWWMLFFLGQKTVIGFSVVTVITSVFIQETFKVATIDDKIMIMSKERARRTHIQKVNALFGHVDQDGNGFLDMHEFTNALADSGLRTWLAAMELEVRDNKQLFELLDADGDGQINVQELVDGVGRLKGVAKSYDLVGVEKCNKKVMNDLQLMQNQLKRIEDRLLLYRV